MTSDWNKSDVYLLSDSVSLAVWHTVYVGYHQVKWKNWGSYIIVWTRKNIILYTDKTHWLSMSACLMQCCPILWDRKHLQAVEWSATSTDTFSLEHTGWQLLDHRSMKEVMGDLCQPSPVLSDGKHLQVKWSTYSFSLTELDCFFPNAFFYTILSRFICDLGGFFLMWSQTICNLFAFRSPFYCYSHPSGK